MVEQVESCGKCGVPFEFPEALFCTVCGAERSRRAEAPVPSGGSEKTLSKDKKQQQQALIDPMSSDESVVVVPLTDADEHWDISEETPSKKEAEMQTKEEKRTVIEEGTTFKGSLESSCPILVRGRIEGELEAPSLTVSVTGAVHGKAKADKIRSEGELAGEYDAKEVDLAGRVKDNTVIRAQSLQVKLATQGSKMQIMFAECEQTEAVQAEPAKKGNGGNGKSIPPKVRTSEPPPALM